MMGMHCMVPGCGKELPEDEKIPICAHHQDVLKERVKLIGTGVITLGGTAVVVIKNGGIEMIKKNGPQIAKAIKNGLNIVKRL